MTSTSGGNYPVDEVAQAWLIKMRGEDAGALRGEFEAWLLASADHGEAYRRAERRTRMQRLVAGGASPV